jgi:hypothetical protein
MILTITVMGWVVRATMFAGETAVFAEVVMILPRLLVLLMMPR